MKKSNQNINVDKVVKQVNRDLYDRGKKAGMTEATEFIMTMVLYTLDYKLENYMTKEQIEEVITGIFNNIDSFRTNHLNSDDYQLIKQQVAHFYDLNKYKEIK